MEDRRLLHFLDLRFALRTSVFAFVGEFEFAVRADQLVLFLRRYHRAAFAALDLPRVGEIVIAARARFALPAELYLDEIEFFFRDHRLMRSFYELPFSRLVVFHREVAVVKGLSEDFVDRGDRQMFSALPFCLPRFQSPFDRFVLELAYRVFAVQKKLEDAAHELEAFGVFDDVPFALWFVEVVEVADGRDAVPPSLQHFRPVPALHARDHVVRVFFRHAELDLEDELVVRAVVVGLEGRSHFLDVPFVHERDDPAAVVGVSGDAVRLPDEESVCLAFFHQTQDLSKHGSAALVRRLFFAVFPHDDEVVLFRVFSQLALLGIDRKHLFVLVLSGLAAIDDVFSFFRLVDHVWGIGSV